MSAAGMIGFGNCPQLSLHILALGIFGTLCMCACMSACVFVCVACICVHRHVQGGLSVCDDVEAIDLSSSVMLHIIGIL